MLVIRQAIRTLLKSPFTTSIAVLSLALGIGANSAVFSLYKQLLLTALPVPAPEELVNLVSPGPRPGAVSTSIAGGADAVFSVPMFRDLERMSQVFTGVAAHRNFTANLAYRGQTLNDQGMLVSGSYFPVLGLQPAIGRLFTPDDDRVPGGHPFVVLSYDYWQRRFGLSPGVINDTLVVNGQALTIIGVAPSTFTGTTTGRWPQVFVPLTMRQQMVPSSAPLDNRRSYWAYLFARLKPGVTVERAEAAINVAYRGILADIEAPLQTGVSAQVLTQFKAKRVRLQDGSRGQSQVQRQLGTPLAMLIGVTGVVLLIACANIANLLLARAASRSIEMAVRLALGARPRQLLTQLLTESCLLGILAGASGIVVAFWTASVIGSYLPGAAATMLFSLDASVVIVAIVLSIGTGVLVGVFPALQSIRPDLVTTLKNQAGQPSGGRGAARFRATLVTGQIALSMALLVSAGLFAKSLANISRADLGFRTEQVVMFSVSPELNGYDAARARLLFERLEEELGAAPGVHSVSAASVALLSGRQSGDDVSVEGYPAGQDIERNASRNQIGPNFFQTLDIPLIAGRDFSAADTVSAPNVAIINEAFARKFNLPRNAVGKRMSTRTDPGAPLDIEIVGIVADAKYNEIKRDAPPQFFLPYKQDEDLEGMTFYVRTSGATDQLVTAIPSIVRRLDSNLPIERLRTMEAQVDGSVFIDKMIGTLSAVFAGLATLLAAIGLYGVLAYTVAQRTREIGLRMALGADATSIGGMVFRQVGRMTIAGTVIGLVAAIGLGYVARSLLFGLDAYEPTVFAAAVAILGLVAAAAGLIPAIRAARIDPMCALRHH
jgi:putative ABC transport system permease protein